MKRLLAMILALALVAAFAGCAAKQPDQTDMAADAAQDSAAATATDETKTDDTTAEDNDSQAASDEESNDPYAGMKSTPEKIRAQYDMKGIGDNPEKKSYHFGLVSKLVHPAYDLLHYGFEIAAAEYRTQGIDVTFDWEAPIEPDPVEQVEKMENELSKNPDAMAVVVTDASIAGPVIDDIVKSGIPVATWTEDVCEDVRSCYIGDNCSFYQMAYDAAEYAAELMGGKGDVVLFVGNLGVWAHQQRADGARDAFANYPDINIVAELADEDNLEKSISQTEQAMVTYPDVKCFFSSNGTAHIGACQAVIDAGKAGDYVIVGSDLNTDTLPMFEQGALSAVYSNNIMLGGYYACRAMVDLADGKVEKGASVLVGTPFLIKANDYEYYADAFGIAN